MGTLVSKSSRSFFGPGIVLLPIDIVLHFVILALLLGSPVARHFAGKSG